MAITISVFPQGGAIISGVICSLFQEGKGQMLQLNDWCIILYTVIFLWAQVDTRNTSPEVCVYVNAVKPWDSVTRSVHRKFHFK